MSGLSFQLMNAHRKVITSWIMCFQPRMKHGIIPVFTIEDAKRMGRCQRLANVSRQLWCARMRQYWHNVSINCFFFHLIAGIACMSLLSVMDEDVEHAFPAHGTCLSVFLRAHWCLFWFPRVVTDLKSLGMCAKTSWKTKLVICTADVT